jgi:hypothetical protein
MQLLLTQSYIIQPPFFALQLTYCSCSQEGGIRLHKTSIYSTIFQEKSKEQ